MYGNTLGEKSEEKKVAVDVVPANETTVAVEMMNTQVSSGSLNSVWFQMYTTNSICSREQSEQHEFCNKTVLQRSKQNVFCNAKCFAMRVYQWMVTSSMQWCIMLTSQV